MMEVIAAALIAFTGPSGQKIGVNPAMVASIRVRRDASGTYYAKEINCLIYTVDGRTLNVVETCDVVRKRLEVK